MKSHPKNQNDAWDIWIEEIIRDIENMKREHEERDPNKHIKPYDDTFDFLSSDFHPGISP